jgi:mRNA interferase MazF
MARILKGDIVRAALDPTIGNEQQGHRPVVVISENIFNEKSGTVIAVAITSQEPNVGFPLTLQLSSKKLPKTSWVKISQIRTLSVKRIGAKIGSASPQELEQIIDGLNEILGGFGGSRL